MRQEWVPKGKLRIYAARTMIISSGPDVRGIAGTGAEITPGNANPPSGGTL